MIYLTFGALHPIDILRQEKELKKRNSIVIIHNGPSKVHGSDRPSAVPDGLDSSHHRVCPFWVRSGCDGASFPTDNLPTNTEL